MANTSVEEVLKFVENLIEIKYGKAIFLIVNNEALKLELFEKVMKLYHAKLFDITANLQIKSLEDTIFKKDFRNKKPSQQKRDQIVEYLPKIILIDNFQDLAINTKRNQQGDMALVRGLAASPHNKILICLGTKSIEKLVKVDERLAQSFMCYTLSS